MDMVSTEDNCTYTETIPKCDTLPTVDSVKWGQRYALKPFLSMTHCQLWTQCQLRTTVYTETIPVWHTANHGHSAGLPLTFRFRSPRLPTTKIWKSQWKMWEVLFFFRFTVASRHFGKINTLLCLCIYFFPPHPHCYTCTHFWWPQHRSASENVLKKTLS